MIEKLIFYMGYPFVRYALIVGVLIALCSSLLGVTLVLKRFSFIGDGLSHVAFGAMAVASVLNLSLMCDFIITDRTKYKNKRRCGDCNDLSWSTCNRLSAYECICDRS